MYVSNIEEIKELSQPLFEQYKIKQVAIFGSFARNENKDQSDVDLVIDFLGSYDLLDLVGLKQELEEILGRKVDLVTLKSISNKDNEFGKLVLSEAKVIYEKN